VVALWSVFAWGLNPPMQGSLLAIAPQAGMTAMALNISGLYLGTGGIVAVTDVRFVPLAGGSCCSPRSR